jgi:hypothetical protein
MGASKALAGRGLIGDAVDSELFYKQTEMIGLSKNLAQKQPIFNSFRFVSAV